jgi:hypothetical protein
MRYANDREDHEKQKDCDAYSEYQPVASREIGPLQAKQRNREKGACDQPLARPANGIGNRNKDCRRHRRHDETSPSPLDHSRIQQNQRQEREQNVTASSADPDELHEILINFTIVIP